MPGEAEGSSIFFWGDGVTRLGIQEQLERLRTRASLAMAVAPGREAPLRETLGRMGFAVTPFGRGLLARRKAIPLFARRSAGKTEVVQPNAGSSSGMKG